MRLLGVLARLLLAGLMCACPGPGEGSRCEKNEDCGSPLVCKAARCYPQRSRVGQPCVTERGCVDGLLCISGRCSEGPADGKLCQSVCQRARGFYLRRVAMAREKATEPPEVFMMRCLDRCIGRMPRERAACILKAKTMEEVDRCP